MSVGEVEKMRERGQRKIGEGKVRRNERRGSGGNEGSRSRGNGGK